MPKILGLSNGCFDNLHEGHIYLFKKAREHCDALIVATNSDEYIRKHKGPGRPIDDEATRIQKILATGLVAGACSFDDLVDDVILPHRPQVLIIGDDYKDKFIVGKTEIESWGGKVVLIEKLPGYSTTLLCNQSKSTLA